MEVEFEGTDWADLTHLQVVYEAVLFFAVTILSLVCNSVLIYSLVRFSKLHIVTKVHLISRAIFDSLIVSILPCWIYYINGKSWEFGAFGCGILFSMNTLWTTGPSLHLLIMLTDLYLVKCCPRKAQNWRTYSAALWTVMAVWFTAVGVTVPVFRHVEAIHHPDDNSTHCYMDWHLSEYGGTEEGWMFYTTCVGYAIPLGLVSVLSVCYLFAQHLFKCLATAKALHEAGSRIQSHENDSEVHYSEVYTHMDDNDDNSSQCTENTTRLVIGLMLVFYLQTLPYEISKICDIFKLHFELDFGRFLEICIYVLITFLLTSVYAVNPILVAYLSDDVRQSIRKTFFRNERSIRDLRSFSLQPLPLVTDQL